MSTPTNVVAIRPKDEPTVDATGRTITRQCRAKSTTSGQRCKKSAMLGQTVCRAHGGASPQAKEAARLRLAGLVMPAITTLAREMTQAPASADRQRAANSILDRAGMSRAASPEVELARTLLIDRLMALRDGEQ